MNRNTQRKPDGSNRGPFPANGAADYLYHRQKKNSGGKAEDRERRASPSDRKAEAHTGWRNLVLVLASMGLFMLIVLFISKKTWQMKESARTRNISSDASKSAPAVDIAKKREETRDLLAGTRRSDAELLQEATLLSRRADLLQAAGQYLQAVEAYSEALTTWPELNATRGELGRLHLRQRAIGKAMLILQSAVSREPDSPSLLNDLGVAFFYQQNFPRAVELFDAAMHYDPQFAPAHFNRALCLLLQSDTAAANDALDAYLKLAPGDAKALKEKAFIEAAQGQYARAYEIQAEALARMPDWVPLLLDAAAVSALMGQPEQAWAHLEHAAAKAPPDVVLKSFRGPAFAEMRNTDKGKEAEKRWAEQSSRPRTASEPPAWDAYGNEPLLSVPPAGEIRATEQAEQE